MSDRGYNSLDANGATLWSRDNRLFIPIFLVAQIVGIAAVALTAALMVMNGGFAWTAKLIFNYHPLFMVLGLVFIYGEAILVYRSMTYMRKYPVKVIHAILQLLAFIFSVIALVAVFNSHNWQGYKNLYSLHGWVGIATVALFGLQWLIAILIYMLPFAPTELRKWMMPIHRSLGLAIFVMAVGAVILGLTEQNYFTGKYSKLPPKVLIANIIGVCSIVYLGLVAYIVTKAEWKRPADEVLHEERISLNK